MALLDGAHGVSSATVDAVLRGALVDGVSEAAAAASEQAGGAAYQEHKEVAELFAVDGEVYGDHAPASAEPRDTSGRVPRAAVQLLFHK
jgi:hypothetical protein